MTRRSWRRALGLAALLVGAVVGAPAAAQGPLPPGLMAQLQGDDGGGRRFGDFAALVRGAKEHDGLFKLYHKDENLYAELQPQHFDKPLLCPIAVAKGAGVGGATLNSGEQWVLLFKRVGDKVHLVRRNVRFRASRGGPTAVALQNTYSDSILMALRIAALNPARGSVVINLNDIFMTNFAQLPGGMDPSRSVWHKVKTFPRNLELEVAATFVGFGAGGSMIRRPESVIDQRGQTLVIHYGLVDLGVGEGYQPRLADPRVGYFLSAVKDFSKDDKDTSFVRYVNRWRLERADGQAWKEGGKLSPPKKKIVFWIEKTVPDEYRPYVRDGILEWNKAFERIGFRDAIEVRQQENEDFDPEDMAYATFRWITTDVPYAIGPSRANPLTGEILDADILFDSSWLKVWQREAKVLARGTTASVVSPIREMKLGAGLADHPLAFQGSPLSWDDRSKGKPTEEEVELMRAHLLDLRQHVCQCTAHKRSELGMAAMALALAQMPKPGDKADAKAAEAKAVDEMIAQAIKETAMHEVGHTLGLRHNFKASTMLKNEQLHDINVTRKQGLAGSVMDYNPVNLAPKGVKQGDYFTTTLGPYDYWAIEYAYKPLPGGTDGEFEELKKIAQKGATPGHDYGTDEDMAASDPLINTWDLGDPMTFGKERMVLAQELLKDLADKVVDNGEGYQRTRAAFGVLMEQYANAAHLVSAFVGGEHLHRDHRGDPNGRDPMVPVTAARQREALKFLKENVLTDKPFAFAPALLRRLAPDRWSHWGNGRTMGSVDVPVYEGVLSVQKIALEQLLDPDTLRRIQNNALKTDKEEPLKVSDVFRCLTDSVWGDLGAAQDKANASAATIRRNLQREHLKNLGGLVLGRSGGGMSFFFFGGEAPPDAKSLARMHLREIDKKVETLLKDKGTALDDTSRAHLEDVRERVAKMLNASMQMSD